MTTLDKPVRRRTEILTDNRRTSRPIDIVSVTLYPAGTDRPATIGFRANRCRKEYQLPLDRAYKLAVYLETAEAKRAAKSGKKTR